LNGKKKAVGNGLDFNAFNCPANLMMANDGKSHPFIGTN